MKKLAILSLPLLILSCASTSDNFSVAKANAKIVEEKVAKKEKMVCEDSRATGSQMKKKRCWSKKEYERMKEESKESLRKAIEQGGTRPPIN